MVYNIYVTNKTTGVEHLYVRLRGDKFQESESYSSLLDEMSVNVSLEKEQSAGVGGDKGVSIADKGKVGFGYEGEKESEQRSRKVFSRLVQGNFCLLEKNKPTPFGVEIIGKLAYLSVHDENVMWLTDFPVDSGRNGCITITGDKNGIFAYPSNPQAVWTECKRGDPLPEGAIYAGKTTDDGDLYFGRVALFSGIPSKVNVSEGNKCYNWWYTYDGERSEKSGDVLIDTGFEYVRANRGDPMPPNAILTGVTETDNSLYVGRAGGNVPCKINLEDGKIWNFWYSNRGEHSSVNGEVVILTNDPAY